VEGNTCAGGADGSISLVQPNTAFLTLAWATPGLEGPVVNGLPAGTYFVTITDTLGCSRTDSLTVTAPPPLMDSVGTTYAYCDKSTGTAQVQSSSTAPGLVFDFGNGPDSSGYAENLPPGTYTVTASDSAGCTQVLTFTIESFGNITASIGADTLWAEDGSTVLTCTLIPPDPLASFVWSPGEGLDAPDSATTTCTVQDTVTYVVHATSGAGCSAFDTVVVVPFFPPDTNTIAPGTACGEFFLPDIFSPNGDGLNDALCPLGGCITQLGWSIYDRWGQRVFEANTPDACWDGTRNGSPLPAGSYLFTFRAVRSTGERIERTGTITLRK
jgi:gliding motility-associated-like protein